MLRRARGRRRQLGVRAEQTSGFSFVVVAEVRYCWSRRQPAGETGRSEGAQSLFAPSSVSVRGREVAHEKLGVVTIDLLARAQAGDGQAFGQLVDPYRRELQMHCYRFLGSVQDAEDALQDTLLSAWQGLAGFEGRASVRTWLYRVATSRCLDALRSARRRPRVSLPPAGVGPPAPTR